MLNNIRYHVVPPVFIVFFTGIVQYLSINGKGEEFSVQLMGTYMLGNISSWTWLAVIFSWAIVSLKIPSKVVKGPETEYYYRPSYKDNGFQYYSFTLAIYVLIDMIFPVSASLFDNFPQLLGSLNITALILCIFLVIKGKYFPSHPKDSARKDPLLYEFYRGVELHPSVFGVDIKQLTNCRIGLMGWQIFICAFFFTFLRRNGFNLAFLVNFILQTVYIAKFFWWEAGYFYTLDMMFDRAGYYICWGCLVWVPCLYTYSSFYIVNHPPSLQAIYVGLIFTLGILSIAINYRIDYEKQIFRNSPNYKCKIWGREAVFIRAEYVDCKGKQKTSALLTSGFWGIARHMNYTFELLAAFSWCSAGGFNNDPMVHYYFLFLFGLLVHRTIRDEQKCREKYGKYWDAYCKKVRFRLVPFICSKSGENARSKIYTPAPAPGTYRIGSDCYGNYKTNDAEDVFCIQSDKNECLELSKTSGDCVCTIISVILVFYFCEIIYLPWLYPNVHPYEQILGCINEAECAIYDTQNSICKISH